MVLQNPREGGFRKMGIGEIVTFLVCEGVLGVENSLVLPGCEVWRRRVRM